MSDYTPVNDYSAKDALSTGDPNKKIKGSDVDADLAAIQTAVATKYDSSDIATQGQAETGTDNATLITPLRAEQHVAVWAAENAGIVGDIQALADPNADRLIIWDDSAGAAVFATPTEGLQISDVEVTLDISGLTEDSSPDTAADYVVTYDASAASHKKVLLDNLLPAAAGAMESAVKTSDESVTSSTTLQDDNELTLTLGAGSWMVECLVEYEAGTTGDIKVYMSGAAGAWWGPDATFTNIEYEKSAAGGNVFPGNGAGTKEYLHFRGIASGGGTVKLQFAQSVSDATSTDVNQYSFLVARKL